MRILSWRHRPARPTGTRPPLLATEGTAPAGAVNGHAVLKAVAALPVSTWRYRWEPQDVRHLGPMAQDWHAAFPFNSDDTVIDQVDAHGVALVCIQALNRRIEELDAEVRQLRESTRINA
ncbi:tail fiber domain-containing protein [Catenulispora sp. NF23]|uniref:Tail fiber domain-containing protein n=1 Tax=Catenulispora pinistramenti TaxID=2705254 RepID=A0ABS5KKW1_9ACTN|nr:tail fiber domain-containing protein [Catenulispora pinistramenti]MBS2531221.1 tail fiber domain-containing protein [Catenulispora pinistramenti]MBS2546681.1 tail fiber domain-containing protein [Catenulispora pinistramenti]